MEYGVIEDFELLDEGELRAIKTLAESDMTADDEDAFNKMAQNGFEFGDASARAATTEAASSSSGAPAAQHSLFTTVKEEKLPEKSANEIMAEKIAWLSSDVNNQYTKYVEVQARMELTLTAVEKKFNNCARDAKYLGPLKADLLDITAKLPKFTKPLKTMITSVADPESKEFIKLVNLKESIDKLIIDVDYAVPNSNLDMAENAQAKKKPRKRKTFSKQDNDSD